MISLLKTVTDMDRLDDLQRTTLECYALAIAATSEHSIEVDRAEAEAFRQHLKALEKRLRNLSLAESCKQVETAFEVELREYRDKSQRRVKQLRQDVSAAADAMKLFAESVSSNGADHEKQVEGELGRLKTLTKIDNLTLIKGGIEDATTHIESSFEQLRRSNQLVIAQLQDEIRLLHQAIQTEKRAVFTDRQSGAWNRHKISERFDELIKENETFCVLVMRIRNLNRLKARYSAPLVELAVKTVLTRSHQMFGDETMIGRWSDDEFVAILSMLPTDAVALSKEVSRKLSGDYSVPELGIVHNIALQVASGVIDRHAGDDQSKFVRNLEKMTEALAKS